MLEFIGKKFVHCFVIASIIFGCSVQAATPSFQEDLDDFDEISQAIIVAPATLFHPVSISWHNEDLEKTLIASYGVSDDLEDSLIQADRLQTRSHGRFILHSYSPQKFHSHSLGLHKAREPPIYFS
jgi:hypothetical protein